MSAGGWQAIAEFMEANVPEAERERAGAVLVRILNGALFELLNLSREQAGLPPLPADEKSQAFLTQAVLSLSATRYFYPAPVALMLTDFKQVQASVFQVARAPGKNIVYLGCAVADPRRFCHAVRARARLWVWLADGDGDRRARRPPWPCRSTARPSTATANSSICKHKLLAIKKDTATMTHHHPHAATTAGCLAPQRLRLGVRRAGARRRGCSPSRAMPARWTSTRRPSCSARCRPPIWLGWFWRPLRVLALVVAAAALLAIASYQGDLARADTVFWLKYFLSSQSAILWMSVLFFMSTLFYWIGFFGGKQGDAMDADRLAPGLGRRRAWR